MGIKLNNQQTTSVPKINGIDMLANAKPIKLNNPKQNEPNIDVVTNNQAQQNMKNSVNLNTTKPIQPQNIAKPAQQPESTKPSIVMQQTLSQKTQTQQIIKNEIKPKETTLPPQPQKATNPQTPPINKQNIQSQMPKAPQTKITTNDLNDDMLKNAITNNYIDSIDRNNELSQIKVDVNQLDFSLTKRVRTYLKKLINSGGSDLHLKAGSKIRARINGDIVIFSEDILSKEDALIFAKELTRGRFHDLTIEKELDMTYIYDANTRFRVNIFFQMEGVSFAFRKIPTTHGTIDELGLPDALNKIVDMERGLVLVTGITGSGKSTTLAAIINEINQKKAKHIITIEDPIEFVHQDAKSMINQRSVGMDTNSFAKALKAALREDPDIILVGEMRDIETIEMALHAAETGHLVLSTLHTLDAKETINRVISVFPSNEQTRIRTTLASTLSAVVSQRLLKSINGGRVAAVELLFKTPRIELIVNEGRDSEILEALAEGKEIYHTQTFDQHLFELVTNGIVSEEAAMEKATSPSDLKLRLQNINFADQQNGDDTITIKN